MEMSSGRKPSRGRCSTAAPGQHLPLPLVLVLLLISVQLSSSYTDPFDCFDDAGNDGLPAETSSPAVCAVQDRLALLQFKASITSDPNHAFAHWRTSSSNCCTWNGITCDRSGRVIRLKLPNQQLTGTLSSSLGSLSALKVLILYQNHLSGSLPSSIGTLSDLQRLCMFQNSISGPIPASYGRLRNLQVLDLSSNKLSGRLPSTIGGMASLLRLRLLDNEISGAIPPSFGLLSRLSTASLADNRLAGRIPDGFAYGLSSLAFLFLSNNRITGLPADLRNLTRLQWVDLSNNPIVDSGAVAGLVTAPHMAQIELASCGLKGPFPSWVARLPDFRRISDEVTPSLDLSNNAISGPIPAAVGRLYLESLSLHCNQLTGSIPASFSGLQWLYGFNVSYNQLSGQIPPVKPFTTFRVSAYHPGNPRLCGTPLPACKQSG